MALSGKTKKAKEKEHVEEAKEEEKVKSDVLTEDKPKEKVEPLQPGQKYFEAPDGTHVIGDADKQQLWYRKLNDGKGGWINPKR